MTLEQPKEAPVVEQQRYRAEKSYGGEEWVVIDLLSNQPAGFPMALCPAGQPEGTSKGFANLIASALNVEPVLRAALERTELRLKEAPAMFTLPEGWWMTNFTREQLLGNRAAILADIHAALEAGKASEEVRR